MKLSSSLLAAGLLICALLACSNNSTNNSNSNNSGASNANNSNGSSSSATGVHIEELYAAKDDGNGKYGDKTTTFSPSDRTVYAVAKLSESGAGTKIKFVWTAVDAGGASNEKVKDIDYTTGPLENIVNGHLTIQQDWPAGKYKVEAYVNGQLEKTVEYTVQ